MKTFSLSVLAAATLLLIAEPGFSQSISLFSNGVSVQLFGAGLGGDDTTAFNKAITATPNGGLLYIPTGNYRITGTLVINKPLTIQGTGLGSQIFEQSNQTLFQLVNVAGANIRDIYVGSAGSGATSLIELLASNHNRIEDVTMLGGGYGLHLYGSLLNTMTDLRSGTNLQGYTNSRFFASTSTNQTWVMAEGYGGFAANANTFIAPVLEGGGDGIHVKGTDGNGNGGQGSATITGGSIEGVAGTALIFDGTFLPSSITGTHFEANKVADVYVNASSNVLMSAILALNNVNIQGDSRNIAVYNSEVETVHVGPITKRISISNLTTGVVNCTGNPFVDNQHPNPDPNATDQYDGTPSVALFHIGPYCYGQ